MAIAASQIRPSRTKLLGFVADVCRAAVVPCAAALLLSSVPAGAQESTAPNKPVELFVVMPIKEKELSSFLPVLLDNARQSRLEKGNHSFDVFISEQGGPVLYLFERWSDSAALEEHTHKPYFKAVQTRLAKDLSGEVVRTHLKPIDKLTDGGKPKLISNPKETRNVIVVFKVKADARATFLAALSEVTPPSRSAPGNLAFDLYEDSTDPTTFVLFERWQNVGVHEAHLAKPYVKKLGDVLPATLSRPEVDGRYLLKDVTQK
jgi:quinol monooxygenase YgiN